MANIGYLDIGAIQRQEGGGGSANTGYLDIGAVQREEAVTPPAPTTSTTQFLMLLGIGT